MMRRGGFSRYRFMTALLGAGVALAPLSASAQSATELAPIKLQAKGESAKGPVDGIVAKRSASATKTGRALVETPQSVSVVTADQIKAQAATTTSEVMRYTPGTNAEIFGADPRADWVRMRGFLVPELLDGTRLPRATYAWPRVDPYMLERVEALRGPAATLYGQTPPGGLINFVSKRPTDTPLREVQLTAGYPGRAQAAFDFGGPVNDEGTLLYRLTGLGRLSQTQVDHVDDNRAFIAPAVTWKPDDKTSLTVLGHHIRDDGGSLQFLPALGMLYGSPRGKYSRDVFIGEPDYDDFKRRQSAIGYIFEHEFDNGITFNSTGRFTQVNYDLSVVRGFGLLAGSDSMVMRRAVGIHDHARAWTLDNNLTGRFDTGPVSHEVLAGVDLLRQTADYTFGVGTADPIDIYNPVYGGAIGPVSTTVSSDQTLKQAGVYLQDEMALNNWRMILSGRHDWSDADTLNRLTGRTTGNDDSAFTGRAALLYLFDNGIAPYMSYATSFEPLLGVSAAGKPYDPTKGKQFEIGVKYQPQGSDSLFTLAAYDLKQNNLLVSGPLGASQIGGIRVRGVEAEAKVNMWEGWDLIASYTYSDSEITATGKRVPYVARNQAALWANHSFDGALEGVSAGAGVRFVGASFGDDANSLKTPSYTLVDAAARLDLGTLNPAMKGSELSLNVSNLFDRDYVSSCNNATSCYWGTGRTIRATLTHRW